MANGNGRAAFNDGPGAFSDGPDAYGPSTPQAPSMNLPSAAGYQTQVPANLGILSPDYPAQRDARLDQLAQRESGNTNQPSNWDPRHSSASGFWQITDPTWRTGATLAGVDPRQYPKATRAPYSVQRQVAQAIYDQYGEKPWAETVRSAPAAVAGRALADYTKEG